MDTNHLKGYKFWESEYFRIRRRAYGYTLLTLSGLLLLWWQVGNLVENRLRNQTREQVAAEVSSYGSALTQSINRRLSVINGLSVFVETEMSHHEELGEEELTLFVAGLYRNTDGILNIALAPDGIMQFVYPYEKNKSVLGYEPSQDERSNVRNDVQRAKDTQRIIVSLPIELIQGGKGIIARQAVFIGDRYWGLSNIVINVELILEDAGMISVQNDLELALRDQSDEIFFGSEGIFDAGPVIYTIFLPEGTWQLAGIPTGGWEARYQSELWFYRILSLIVVGTLTLLTYQYSRRRDRLKLLVKHRTRDLQEIESKYRNLVDNSLVGIYITQNHHIKFANEGLADLFGYKSAGELIGIHVQKLVTSQSWEVVQKEVQLWESGQKKSSNYRFKGLRKDGNTLDIEALGVITKYQGQPALQGVLIDITERVRAEERFKGLSEASFEAIFISEKGICLEANLAAEKLFGYSQEEAVGMSGSDIFVLEDRNRVIANLLSGYEDPYQARALRKDGSTFIAEVHGKTMYYKGRAVRVTSIRDISKRVQVEEEYRNLFNSVPVGIYSSTPDGRFLDGNPALLKILGYPNNETMFASDVNDLFITRTDREDELGLIEQEGSVINHILQLRRYDGEIIWVQDSSSAIRDSSGKTRHYYGRMEDITEQLETEKALRESEEQYRSLIEQSNDVIYLLNENHFEIVNSQFTEIFGVTAEEACSPDFDFMTLVAPQSREMVKERARKINLGEDLPSRYEFTAYDKDGKEIEMGVSVSYIAYKGGAATQGILHDITERKQAEDALKIVNQELQRQLDENKKLEVALREQATRDPLTGLFNRRYMEEILEQELAKASRRRNPFSIVILDLDGLKEINDTYGHIAGGDQALKRLADMLTQVCRTGDTICRYGGDEFLVMLYETPAEAAFERALQWKEALRNIRIFSKEKEFGIAFSAGVAAFPRDGLSSEEILVHADDALYRAKELGRNQVVSYQKDMT